MRTLKLALLLAVLVSVDSLSERQENFAAFAALKAILIDYFVVNDLKVDIFFYGPNSETLANRLLRVNSPKLSTQVICLDSLNKATINAPSIFLFDSLSHYESFTKEKDFTSESFINQVVFYPKARIESLPLDFGLTEEGRHFILVINETTVDLVTNFWFTPGLECNVNVMRTINQFSLNTMRWQNATFFPEKYRNFYNCSLIMTDCTVYMSAIDRHQSGLIWDALAQHFNFILERTENSDCTERNKLPYHNLEDMIFFHTIQNSDEHIFASAIFDDHVTLTVPAGEPYSQLEKMFLMFDKETWICIGVTLAGSLLVIQVINFMSIQLQNFVFGREVRTPTLNVADIFLNGGQNRVPGRNFARFMLMMFVIWALIIRTCYQSELYKNLQTDMRRPRVKTIDEMNEKNFTLVCLNGQEQYFEECKGTRQVGGSGD